MKIKEKALIVSIALAGYWLPWVLFFCTAFMYNRASTELQDTKHELVTLRMLMGHKAAGVLLQENALMVEAGCGK